MNQDGDGTEIKEPLKSDRGLQSQPENNIVEKKKLSPIRLVIPTKGYSPKNEIQLMSLTPSMKTFESVKSNKETKKAYKSARIPKKNEKERNLEIEQMVEMSKYRKTLYIPKPLYRDSPEVAKYKSALASPHKLVSSMTEFNNALQVQPEKVL